MSYETTEEIVRIREMVELTEFNLSSINITFSEDKLTSTHNFFIVKEEVLKSIGYFLLLNKITIGIIFVKRIQWPS